MVGPARRELVKNGNLEIVRKKTVVPDGVSGRAFFGFAAPVLTLILGKIAAFGFMTHVAAALPGQPVTLAAHQIILSLFFFVSPFLEVISQTAQTFLPPFFAPVKDYVVESNEKDASYNVARMMSRRKSGLQPPLRLEHVVGSWNVGSVRGGNTGITDSSLFRRCLINRMWPFKRLSSRWHPTCLQDAS